MQEELKTEKVGQSIKNNGKWVAKESKEVAQKAEGLIDQASDFATKTYEQVVDASGHYLEGFSASSTKFVRQYPMQTAVGALAVGFILGSIAFRRK